MLNISRVFALMVLQTLRDWVDLGMDLNDHEISIEYKALHFLNDYRKEITEDILRIILLKDFGEKEIARIIKQLKEDNRYILENGMIKFMPDGESRHQFFTTLIRNRKEFLSPKLKWYQKPLAWQIILGCAGLAFSAVTLYQNHVSSLKDLTITKQQILIESYKKKP